MARLPWPHRSTPENSRAPASCVHAPPRWRAAATSRRRASNRVSPRVRQQRLAPDSVRPRRQHTRRRRCLHPITPPRRARRARQHIAPRRRGRNIGRHGAQPTAPPRASRHIRRHHNLTRSAMSATSPDCLGAERLTPGRTWQVTQMSSEKTLNRPGASIVKSTADLAGPFEIAC
jgi:hypothetical protein